MGAGRDGCCATVIAMTCMGDWSSGSGSIGGGGGIVHGQCIDIVWFEFSLYQFGFDFISIVRQQR